MSKIQSDTEHLILNADGSGKEVRFQNNGTQNVVIDSSGNVGIGTASPGSALDVTGTVTADGLTVDGGTTTTLTLNGNRNDIVFTEGDTTDLNTLVRHQTGLYRVDTINDALSSITQRFSIDHSTGDISFYEDTGTTAKLFWDASAESLGIGTDSLITTSGRSSLTISTANEKGHLNLQNRTATTASDAGNISFYNGNNPICNISVMADGATNSGRLIFQTYNAGTPVRSLDIDKNGDVQFKNSAGNVRLYWDNSAEGLVSAGAGISFDAGSNYLDDYEEGTASGTLPKPTATTASYERRYKKIGNLVVEVFKILIAGKTGGSGNVAIPLSFTPLGFPDTSTHQGGSIGKNTIDTGIAYFGTYGANPQVYANTLSGGYRGVEHWADGSISFTVIYYTS